MSFFYFVNLPNLLAVAHGGSSPRLALPRFASRHFLSYTHKIMNSFMSALRESIFQIQRNFNSDIYYYFWPYPSRTNPTWIGLACKSLNFWHFFKLRDIVLLPACVRERERDERVEGAVSAMRGVCASCSCLMEAISLVRNTHIFQCQRHVAFATISTWFRDSVLDLWLPNILSISPPSFPLFFSLINRSTSGISRWIFHCQNLISCFWFYFISFWFCFSFCLVLLLLSFLSFGFQFRPS